MGPGVEIQLGLPRLPSRLAPVIKKTKPYRGPVVLYTGAGAVGV